MEPFDLNTRLPPRKRLLAGLRKESQVYDFMLSIPFISSNLGARLRDVIYSPTGSGSLEEIIEVSKSVALDAADVAIAARNTAIQKTVAATKARAAAKQALELLNSITRDEMSRKGCIRTTKLRKRQVPIKLLYKIGHHNGNQDTNGELARKKHRAISSYQRTSNKKQKNLHYSKKEIVHKSGVVCSGSSPAGIFQMASENFEDKSEDNTVVSSKNDILERQEVEPNIGTEAEGIAGGRKVKVK